MSSLPTRRQSALRRCLHLLAFYELGVPLPGTNCELTLPQLHRLWRAILSEEL